MFYRMWRRLRARLEPNRRPGGLSEVDDLMLYLHRADVDWSGVRGVDLAEGDYIEFLARRVVALRRRLCLDCGRRPMAAGAERCSCCLGARAAGRVTGGGVR